MSDLKTLLVPSELMILLLLSFVSFSQLWHCVLMSSGLNGVQAKVKERPLWPYSYTAHRLSLVLALEVPQSLKNVIFLGSC